MVSGRNYCICGMWGTRHVLDPSNLISEKRIFAVVSFLQDLVSLDIGVTRGLSPPPFRLAKITKRVPKSKFISSKNSKNLLLLWAPKTPVCDVHLTLAPSP